MGFNYIETDYGIALAVSVIVIAQQAQWIERGLSEA
jgi:hypothetical protein